ncbi:unnamed protein product, partial [Amoebophrya sp. A25]
GAKEVVDISDAYVSCRVGSQPFLGTIVHRLASHEWESEPRALLVSYIRVFARSPYMPKIALANVLPHLLRWVKADLAAGNGGEGHHKLLRSATRQLDAPAAEEWEIVESPMLAQKQEEESQGLERNTASSYAETAASETAVDREIFGDQRIESRGESEDEALVRVFGSMFSPNDVLHIADAFALWPRVTEKKRDSCQLIKLFCEEYFLNDVVHVVGGPSRTSDVVVPSTEVTSKSTGGATSSQIPDAVAFSSTSMRDIMSSQSGMDSTIREDSSLSSRVGDADSSTKKQENLQVSFKRSLSSTR